MRIKEFIYPVELIEKALEAQVFTYEQFSLRDCLFNEISEYLKDSERNSGKQFAEMMCNLGEAISILEPSCCSFEMEDDYKNWTIDNWKLFNKALIEILKYLFYRD